MAEEKAAVVAAAKMKLRTFLGEPNTVYIIKKKLSRSNISIYLQLLIVHEGEILDITTFAALILGRKYSMAYNAMISVGTQSDMGAEACEALVHRLNDTADGKLVLQPKHKWL